MGAGFLGVEVAQQAKRGGWAVFPVVRSEETAEKLRAEFPQVQAVDAGEPSFWETQGGDWAGMVWAMAPSKKRSEDGFVKMQREGAERGAEWAQRFGVRMVYLSSTSVYAESEGGWVQENSPVAGDERAAAMVAAEKKTLGAGGSVLRCAGLYGGERKLRDRGEGPPRWLNVIQVEDAARAVGVGLRVGGEIFNVAEDEPRSRGVMGGTWSGESGRTRRNKRVRNAKLKREGWRPRHAAEL